MLTYGLGTLPAAVLILANNYAITGSPFQLSYGSNPLFPELAAATSYGFNVPELSAIRGLLWGEYRGLFFWSPVLFMAVPGFYYMFRKDRGLAIMAMSACLMVLLQSAAFYTWFGGNAVGPRYLSPILPLIGLAAAYAIERWPEPGLVVSIISILLMLGVTAIAIDPPGDVMTPLQSFYSVRLEQNRFADNLGTLIGLPLWLSLVVPLVLPAVAAWRLLKEADVSA